MKVVVIGGAGHGRVIIDILEKAGRFTLLGLLDAHLPIGENVLGYEVIGREDDLPSLIDQRQLQGVVIAVGDNWLRAKVVASVRAMAPNVAFPNAIHPSAQIGKNVRFGQGNVVMAGVVVNSNATVGDFCVLNTRCSVDHDARLGDFVSFAPNSCAGGNVEVGDYSAVCLGANVIHQVRIGPHAVVGAGATVLRDLPGNVLAYGTPARVVRERRPGDKYV
jgi:sugar O-acyltransferase (sialic acid O-acetyltransferase NeuD family)